MSDHLLILLLESADRLRRNEFRMQATRAVCRTLATEERTAGKTRAGASVGLRAECAEAERSGLPGMPSVDTLLTRMLLPTINSRLLTIHDPDLLSLRTAARATLVVPVVFAVGCLVFGNAGAGLFAAFGAFAPIVFANFGGPPRSRAVAHLVTAFGGAALIVLGTALSGTVIGATVAAFAVVFAVRMVAVFGGQFERAGRVLVLAFVIAVATSAPVSQAGTRVAAWLGAGALAAFASLALWPRDEWPSMLRRAAAACRALAAAARDPSHGADATHAIEEFRAYFARVPFRAAGPFERDRAMLRLFDELVLLGAYLRTRARGPADERFAALLADVLDSVAARLSGASAVPDLRALEQAALAHRSAIEARAGDELRSGGSADDVLERLDASFGLRIAYFATLCLAANASIATGATIPAPDAFEVPPDAPTSSGLSDAVRVGSRQLRRRLAPSSARLRDAVRGATGVATAMFVALAAGFHHGTWVVLGTLAVLRSNALGTGRGALQVIVATTVGFIAGSALLLALGAGDTALWIALPFAVFLAAYPAGTHFVTGQAAYTVFVLVLYNLVRPSGLELGLVRLSHVAIGAGVSLILGVLLWPRGARETLRRNLADAFHAGARYMADALAAVAGARDAARVEAIRASLVAAMDRSSDAFRQHLGEPGRATPMSTWRRVLAGPRHLRAAGDSLRRIALRYPAPEAESADFTTAARALIHRYHAVGDAIESGAPDKIRELAPSPTPVGDAVRARVIAALEACRSAPDEHQLNATLRLIWTRDWLRRLESLADELRGPVADVAISASVPWWRH